MNDGKRDPLGKGGRNDWLSTVTPLPQPRPAPTAGGGQTGETPRQPSGRAVTKVTVELPAGLAERLRNAVYWLSGPPERLTVAGVVVEAVNARVDELEASHNEGRPFKPRPERIRTGRPVGS